MMRMIRTAVVLSVAFISMCGFAHSQSAQPAAQAEAPAQAEQARAEAIPPDQQATKEQLEKLFDVMRLRQQMQSMRQIVPSMVQQQITSALKQTEADAKLTPEQRESMQKVMSKYVGKAMDLYPAEEMLTDMVAIYQRHLTRDDVDGLIVFYSSPAGQHLLDAQPAIAQEYMPIVMGKVQERSQVMTKEMMKEMAEIAPTAKPAATKSETTKPPKQ